MQKLYPGEHTPYPQNDTVMLGHYVFRFLMIFTSIFNLFYINENCTLDCLRVSEWVENEFLTLKWINPFLINLY